MTTILVKMGPGLRDYPTTPNRLGIAQRHPDHPETVDSPAGYAEVYGDIVAEVAQTPLVLSKLGNGELVQVLQPEYDAYVERRRAENTARAASQLALAANASPGASAENAQLRAEVADLRAALANLSALIAEAKAATTEPPPSSGTATPEPPAGETATPTPPTVEQRSPRPRV